MAACGGNPNQTDANGTLYQADYRSTHSSGHSLIYALDAQTGKMLYSSGDAISGWSHFAGLAIAGGRVYAETSDSSVYAFALPE